LCKKSKNKPFFTIQKFAVNFEQTNNNDPIGSQIDNNNNEINSMIKQEEKSLILETDQNVLLYLFKCFLPHHSKILANVCKYFYQLVGILRKSQKEEKTNKITRLQEYRRKEEFFLLQIKSKEQYQDIMVFYEVSKDFQKLESFSFRFKKAEEQDKTYQGTLIC
jgi:hypothetical protein